MSDSSLDNVEFVGCDLHYHADKPAFGRNPAPWNPKRRGR